MAHAALSPLPAGSGLAALVAKAGAFWVELARGQRGKRREQRRVRFFKPWAEVLEDRTLLSEVVPELNLCGFGRGYAAGAKAYNRSSAALPGTTAVASGRPSGSRTAARAAEGCPRELRFAGARQTLEAFRETLARATAAELPGVVQAVLKAIASHRVGDRPDRYEPRVRKRRPKQYPLRKEPREQARERLAKARS